MLFNKVFIITFLLFACSFNSWALSTDKDQPVEVEADSFHLDDAKKITTYKGDVVVTQGSMEIKADTVTIYGREGTTDRVLAFGNPVKFKQQPDGNAQLTRGEGLKFEYLVTKDTLILTKNAVLWQGGNVLKSERIVYDSKRATVKAGEKSTNKGRVKVTLEPQKK